MALVGSLNNQGRYGLVMFRVPDGQRVALTSQRYNNFSASFSPDGRWLWFLSDRNFVAMNGTPANASSSNAAMNQRSCTIGNIC